MEGGKLGHYQDRRTFPSLKSRAYTPLVKFSSSPLFYSFAEFVTYYAQTIKHTQWLSFLRSHFQILTNIVTKKGVVPNFAAYDFLGYYNFVTFQH